MSSLNPDRRSSPSAAISARRLLGADYAIAWVFLAPLILVLLVLIAYPFVSAIILSFQQKVVGRDPVWVGLGNYDALLFGAQYSNTFWTSVRVSFVYVAVSIALKFVLGMAMALLLNQPFRGQTLMRAILFIPWAMPSLIVALAWRWIYEGTPNGLLNLILIDWFGSQTSIQWLADPKIALWSVTFAAVWQGTPFWTMMLLAGMQAISHEMYEAAELDGASIFQQFFYITLPSLRPVLVITSLLSTIWTANSINFIYILTKGGPVNATMTFPMLAFDIGIIGARQLGLAAAVSVIFFPIFIVAIYILTNRMLANEAQS
jgi:multiple sugar transport system permease protein